MMAEMNDFQKSFLIGTQGGSLFTQKEFDEALNLAKAEIMAMAIEASRTAVMIEREACAKIVDEAANAEEEGELSTAIRDIAELIRNRIPSQRKQ